MQGHKRFNWEQNQGRGFKNISELKILGSDSEKLLID